MKTLYRILIPVVGAGVLLVGWVKYQENYGIFFPRSYPQSRIDRLPESVEFVRFESRDGVELTALLKRGRPDSPAIVFTHGNGGHMLDRLPWIKNGFPEGWTGLLLDYRGYGRSEGTPSVSGVKTDARSAVDFVKEEVNPSRLFLYGRSLGVPLAAYASQFHKTEGIILESGFPDVQSVAPHFVPVPGVSYLVGVEMNTLDYIENAEEKYGSMRKLVVHGTRDRILPVALGRRLYKRLSEPKKKLFIQGASHNNLRALAGERYYSTVRNFLTRETVEAERAEG